VARATLRGVSSDLHDRLVRDREAERPTLLRLQGPGAYAAAASVASICQDVSLGQAPEAGDVLWLHDGPGVRAHADTAVASFALRPRPGAVLLTGLARDGGHPDLMEVLEVGEGPSGTASPTRVGLPDLPGDPAALATRVRDLDDGGEFTWAHGAWEALRDLDPARAGPLRWIDVRRLNSSGRAKEVMDRAQAGLQPGDDTDELLYQVAVAAHSLCRAERAETLLGLLAISASRPGLRADAQSLLDELLIHDLRPHAIPHRPHILASHSAVLRRQGKDVARHPVPTRYQTLADDVAMRQEDATTAALAVELGVFRRAARLHRNSGPSRAVLAYADQLERRVELDCRRALERGDIVEGRRHLARLSQAAQNWAFTHRALATNRALIAVWDDDVAQLERLLLERFDPEMPGLHRDRQRQLERLLTRTEGAPPHARATVLHSVALHGNDELRSRAHAALEALPPRPMYLGAYALERPIGHGGTADVWCARHASQDQDVAVKVLRGAAGHTWQASFRDEIELTTRLEHPAIVGVLDFGTVNAGAARQSGGRLTDGQPFLVMELVEGGTLADHVGRLAPSEVKDIALALLDALAYAHSRGVVHRDLKPANVLVTKDGQIRLADFGLAGLEGLAAGTPAYMAPEQFHGVTDPRTDLYGLGCTLWHLLTRSPPFEGGPTELAKAHASAPLPPVEGLPPAMAGWLRTCLAKSPTERFPSAAAARHALVHEQVGTAHASTGFAPIGAAPPTFVLDTMLDLPEMTGPAPVLSRPIDERTTLRPPLPRAAFRARPPTANLQDRGDPPLIGQAEARQALRTAFEEVLRTRRPVHVTLTGEAGVGHHALVRALRNEAREQGFAVASTAQSGLAVLDGTGTSPDDWTGPLAAEPPWLVVHTDGPPSGQAIPVRLLEPLELFFVARSRVPLEPATVVRAGAHAVGRPGLLLRLLEEWRVRPGFQASPFGLTLRGEPPRSLPSVRQFWEEALEATDVETRRAVTLAAHLQDSFAEASFRAVAKALGQPATLPGSWLDGRYGRHTLPPELRALVLQRCPDTRDIHQAAAQVTHHEREASQRKVWHAVLGGETHRVPQLVATLRRMTLRPYGPRQSSLSRDALRLATELSLGLGATDLAWVDVARSRSVASVEPQQSLRLARRAEEAARGTGSAALQVAAWACAARVGDPGPPDGAIAALPNIAAPLEQAWCGALLGPSLRSRGHLELAEQVREHVIRQSRDLEEGSDLRASIALDRSFGVPVEDMAATLDPAFAANDDLLRAFAYQHLAHAHLALGRPAEAFQAAERADALAPGSPIALINLASAAAMLGRNERALEAALHATRIAYLGGPRTLAAGAQTLAAALTPHWPEARWQDFAASLGPPDRIRPILQSDPTLCEATRMAAASLPPSRQRVLAALL